MRSILVLTFAAFGCSGNAASPDASIPRDASELDTGQMSLHDAGSVGGEADGSADTEDGGDDGADAGSPGDGGTPVSLCSGPPTMEMGVAYADTHAANLLDLYVPAEGERCPLLVWVHGGGWRRGSRSLGAELRTALFRQIDRGFAVASIDYRLSGDAPFPSQIHDVKAAVRWLRENAVARRLDPDRIAIMGTSAGGHLVALAGTSGGARDLEDLTQGNPDVSSTVRAVVDCFGPTDFAAMDDQLDDNGCPLRSQTHSGGDSPESLLLACPGGLATCPDDVMRANPISYVDATDPPFLIGHGAMDCTVPPGQSEALRDALVGAGVEATLHVNPDAGHEFAACPLGPEVDDFLDRAFGVVR